MFYRGRLAVSQALSVIWPRNGSVCHCSGSASGALVAVTLEGSGCRAVQVVQERKYRQLLKIQCQPQHHVGHHNEQKLSGFFPELHSGKNPLPGTK